MKTVCSVCLALCLIVACHSDKKSAVPSEIVDANNIAPLEKDSDTVATAELPVAADEIFDDFIYGFMKNSQRQRERIVFPLAHVVDGIEKKIEKTQWKFDRLYSKQEIYTTLFADEHSVGKDKDKNVNHVTVDFIYLQQLRMKQYIFNRIRGRWMLTRLEERALDNDTNRDFYKFYHDFTGSEKFQMSHIRNPFEFKTYDFDNFQDIEGTLSVEQWPSFRPMLPKGTITNINYGQSFSKTNERVLVLSGISDGLSCSLIFHKIRGKWMLTKFIN